MHIKEVFGRVASRINRNLNIVPLPSPELEELISDALRGNLPEVKVFGRSSCRTYVDIYEENRARISVPLTRPECRFDGGPLWEKSFLVFPDENGKLEVMVEGTFPTDGKGWPY